MQIGSEDLVKVDEVTCRKLLTLLYIYYNIEEWFVFSTLALLLVYDMGCGYYF